MGANKTSLSCGSAIRKALLNNKSVTGITKKIFPVVTTEAILPYVLYRRVSMDHNPTKALRPGADTVNIEVVCFAETYAGSIELAESVRAALDYHSSEEVRSCILTDSEESYAADAYVQTLVFTIKT